MDQPCEDLQQRKKDARIEDVFSQKDIVSRVIDKIGNLLVCFEKSRIKGVGVHTLIFNDTNGNWTFNLWYSETIQHSHVYKSREELLQECRDFFVLLREKDRNNTLMRTMICRSWRVRDNLGKLRLPLPLKNVLLMK